MAIPQRARFLESPSRPRRYLRGVSAPARFSMQPKSSRTNPQRLSLRPSRHSRSRSTRWTCGVRVCLCGCAAECGCPNGGRDRIRMAAKRRITCCDADLLVWPPNTRARFTPQRSPPYGAWDRALHSTAVPSVWGLGPITRLVEPYGQYEAPAGSAIERIALGDDFAFPIADTC